MKFLLVLLLASLSYGQSPPATDKSSRPDKEKINKKLNQGVDTSNRREYSEEELLQKFFNKKPQPKNIDSNSKIFFPMFYEGMIRPLDQIRARGTSKISGFENVEVDGLTVVKIMSHLVVPEGMKKAKEVQENCEYKLEKKAAGTEDNICWVPITAFDDPNVRVVFDDKSLEIRLRVIPSLRTLKITSFTRTGANAELQTNEPSWLSSYINMNLIQTFQSNNVVYKNGREPMRANYDSATHFGKLLVEASGRSLEKRTEAPSNDPSFIRENVRAVVDMPSWGLRSQLGDLTYPTRSFQYNRAMAGFSLFTQSALQSQMTTITDHYELNLLRPSKVAISINNKIMQTISLPAGKHDLRDFPFGVGQNDLKLEITDDLGRTEVINYSILINNELLKVGEHEVSYATGAPWTEIAGERVYDSKNLITSIFHRYGFTQGLTLGATYQNDPVQTNSSLEFLFSTSTGYFLLQPAYSINEDHPAGYAGRLRYVKQDMYGENKTNKSYSLEANYESLDYTPFGTRNANNMAEVRLQGTHTRALSKNTNLNLSLSYTKNREFAPTIGDSYSISIGGSRRWTDGLSTNLNLRHSRGATGLEEISLLLFLIWSQPLDRQYVTVSTETATSSSRADWTYQPHSGVGGSRSRVNVQNKQTGGGYGGDYEYTGNRARISASHQVELRKEDLNQTPPQPSRSVHTTNLQLGTALVFAGGRFAFSRPVFDSFAMFVPLKNVQEGNVMVNPQKDGTYLSETDWFGPAVAPEVPSYTLSSFILKQKEYKLGVSLPKDHFMVKPRYRSGYAIPIGTDATVYLKTKLLNEDGSPGAMLAGQAMYLDDNSAEPVTIFTNRSGLVRSEGFRPGRYRLEISEQDFAPIEFVIPETAVDTYDLPALKLKARKK